MARITDSVIYDRYEIHEKLGKGGFGVVYAAFDKKHDQQVAIKVDSLGLERSALRKEKKIYERLWSQTFPIGIPRPISFLRYGRSDLLVLPMLKCSLKDLWKRNGCLSVKSICMIGVQMLNRLEHIHKHGILHLDVKPENMMIGRGKDSKTVYLIDYGLSRRYTDKRGVHLPYKEMAGFVGTPVFASVHVDEECERSPRDDLESLFYSLMILHTGRLPWCHGDWGRSANFPEDIEAVKWEYRDFICCSMPKEFQRAWRIVCSMDFGDTPRYNKLRDLFMAASILSSEADEMYFGNE